MVKKQIWRKNKAGIEDWQEVNLSANRIALNHIRKNIGRRKFTLTEFQNSLGVDRVTANNWLKSLRDGKFLNSKSIGPRSMLDNRIYKISLKGIKKLPRRKGVKEEPEIREVEVPVEKEIKLIDKIKFLEEK